MLGPAQWSPVQSPAASSLCVLCFAPLFDGAHHTQACQAGTADPDPFIIAMLSLLCYWSRISSAELCAWPLSSLFCLRLLPSPLELTVWLVHKNTCSPSRSPPAGCHLLQGSQPCGGSLQPAAAVQLPLRQADWAHGPRGPNGCLHVSAALLAGGLLFQCGHRAALT